MDDIFIQKFIFKSPFFIRPAAEPPLYIYFSVLLEPRTKRIISPWSSWTGKAKKNLKLCSVFHYFELWKTEQNHFENWKCVYCSLLVRFGFGFGCHNKIVSSKILKNFKLKIQLFEFEQTKFELEVLKLRHLILWSRYAIPFNIKFVLGGCIRIWISSRNWIQNIR